MSHEGAEVLRYVYPYRGLHYVTMVFGKTQSCLSELQYEALNKSNIYECINVIFLCGFVSIKAFLI